jgi:hypothetical protein
MRRGTMPRRIFELPVQGQESLVVEVKSDEKGTLADVGIEDKVIVLATGFERLKSTIQSAAKIVATTLSDIGEKAGPDEYSIEFGLKLDFKQTVIITQATEEANFTVSMTWKRQKE